MAKKVVNAIFTARKGQSSSLPTLKLLPGEFSIALNTKKVYIGDGTGAGDAENGFLGKILLNPDQSETAKSLETARLIGIVGAATGSASFDGSEDVNITLVLKDSGVTAGTYAKVTVDKHGIITAAEDLDPSDIPELTLQKITDAGTAAGYDAGNGAGQLPIVGPDGKLDTTVMPASSITDTYIVESEEDMLALGEATPNAERGDVAVRNDENKCYILMGDDPSELSNWVYLKTPTDMVYSVNGHTGNVINLTKGDVGLSNVTNESKETMFTNPTFTGDATAETPDDDDDSDLIATTAFVKAQKYLREDDAIVFDGGEF